MEEKYNHQLSVGSHRDHTNRFQENHTRETDRQSDRKNAVLVLQTLLNDLAANGDVVSLDKIFKSKGLFPTEYGMNCAAANGHNNVLDWGETFYLRPSHEIQLSDKNKNFAENVLYFCENNPRLKLPQIKDPCKDTPIVHQESIFPTSQGMNGAVRNGHHSILEWGMRHLIVPSKDMMDLVIEIGDLNIIMIFKEFVKSVQGMKKLFDVESVDIAAKHGHLGILKFLHENNKKLTPSSLGIQLAQNNGFMNIVDWVNNIPKKNMFIERIVKYAGRPSSAGFLTSRQQRNKVYQEPLRLSNLHRRFSGGMTEKRSPFSKGITTPRSRGKIKNYIKTIYVKKQRRSI